MVVHPSDVCYVVMNVCWKVLIASGHVYAKLNFKSRTKTYIYSDHKHTLKTAKSEDFPGGAVVKNLPANSGDTGSIPGP